MFSSGKPPAFCSPGIQSLQLVEGFKGARNAPLVMGRRENEASYLVLSRLNAGRAASSLHFALPQRPIFNDCVQKRTER